MTLASVLAAKNLQSGVGGGGGNTITGGGLGFNFDSLLDAKSTNITAAAAGGPSWLRTQGYYTAGEGGGLYVRQSSPPSWGGLAGYFQSLDGSYWVLSPENMVIHPTQFGAVRGKDFNDASFDQWQFFDDAIWFIQNQGYRSQLTIEVESSWYYLSKPLTLVGGTGVGIRGSGAARDGSVLWWSHNTHGIIIGHAQSGYITIDAEGGPYNGNFAGLFVGDTRYNIGGDNHVYVCTVAGIPGGWNAALGQWASPPGGTGSDIIDGTVHWAYQRELTRLELLAISNGRGGGAGTIDSISLYCGTNWQSPRIINNHSGLVARQRCIVHNIFAASWPGCGMAFNSSGDLTFRGDGNSNGWRADHIVCYWNGMDGFHLGNSNTNAGTLIDGDFAANGRHALANFCFLDNSFTSCEAAYDGATSGGALVAYPHGVAYNGRYYVARIPIGGIEPDQTFATYQSPVPSSSSYWIYIGGDGTWGPSQDYPTFSASANYEPGGGYASSNVNDRSVFTKMYVEGGTFWSQFQGNNLILGGLLQNSLGGTVWNDKKWTQQLSVAGAAVDTTTGVTKQIQYNFGYGTGGGTATTSYPKNIFNINEYEGTQFIFEGNSTRFDQTDWQINSLATNAFNRYRLMTFCPLNTAQQWGTGAAQTNTVHISNLIVGTEDTSQTPDGRKVFQHPGNAAPSTGTHAKGEVALNMDGGVGDPISWKCSATGSPGTWRSTGNLA